MATPQYKTIAVDFICDTTAVPSALLTHYRALNLHDDELIFLLQLLRLRSERITLDFASIEAHSAYSKEEVKAFVCALIEKGFIAMDDHCKVNLNALFDKFKEVWAWQKKQDLDQAAQVQPPAENDAAFAALYRQFEEEMGRPLSSIEGEQIKDWFYTVALPPELIREALKRAVLAGVYKFTYIDKIILDWRRKGYRTLAEVRREDEEHEQKKGKKAKDKAGEVKYRDYDDAHAYDGSIYEV